MPHDRPRPTRRRLLTVLAPGLGAGAAAWTVGALPAGAARVSGDSSTVVIDPTTLEKVTLPGHGSVPGEIGRILGPALQVALDKAAPSGTVPGVTNVERDRGTTIVLPALSAGETYYIETPVRLPPGKNIRLTSTAPRGARIRAAEGLTETLIAGGADGPSGARFRSHIFEDLVFHRAGVLIEQGARGETAFRSCYFYGIDEPDGPPAPMTTRWAIRTGGPGVVGVRIEDCTFAHGTGGGVLNGHRASDNWLIGDNSLFVRLGGPGVETRSPSVTIRNALFETKRVGYGDQPYIRVADSDGYGGGLTRIVGCRFGGEKGQAHHGPPKYCIELTPDTGSVISAVQIEGNWFNGHAPAQGADPDTCEETPAGNPESALAAIRIGRTAHMVHIAGNYFKAFQYHGPVVDDAPPMNNPPPGVNTFSGNHLELRLWNPQACAPLLERRLPTREEIFTNGGAGWSIWPA